MDYTHTEYSNNQPFDTWPTLFQLPEGIFHTFVRSCPQKPRIRKTGKRRENGNIQTPHLFRTILFYKFFGVGLLDSHETEVIIQASHRQVKKIQKNTCFLWSVVLFFKSRMIWEKLKVVQLEPTWKIFTVCWLPRWKGVMLAYYPRQKVFFVCV